MPRQEIKIESILDGWGLTQYQSSKGAIDSSIAIDPDLPLSPSEIKASGQIVPAQYADFSGSNLSGTPLWMITNQKDESIYVYQDNGSLITYNASFGDETFIGSVTNSSGNGAAYYNNYIYLSGNTDIARYGPLDGTPSLVNGVWTSSVLGTQTALTNTTYPSIRGVTIPNHPMHVHGDFALYVGDVVDGQGVIHKIQTSKTTNEGDTDDGSSYNVLDLPFGFLPVAIEAWGINVVILAIQTTSSNINQGKAALFFWDAVDTDSFQKGPVFLPDSIGTALLNVNGALRIFSGNINGGTRVSKYIGGDTIIDKDVDTGFIEDSAPPLAGAVDYLGNRGVWGGYTTYPTNAASVWAIGSKNGKVPMGVHNIVKTTSSDTSNQIVCCLKYIQNTLIVGWADDTTSGIDKPDTSGTVSAVLRTPYLKIGQRFQVKELRVPLGDDLASGMSIVPVIYLDDASTSRTLTAITSANYSDASDSRKVIYREPELSDAIGRNNMFLEFTHSSTVALPQLLPIKVIIETWDEED